MNIKTYNLSAFPEGLNIPRINYEIDLSKIRVSRKSTSVDEGAGTATFEFWSDLITIVHPDTDQTDEAMLDDIVNNHSAKPLVTQYLQLSENKDHQGNLKVVIEPKISGIEYILTSHDFTKPITWYQASQHHVNVELTSIDNINYSASGYVNWIDLERGLVLREELIQPYFPISVYVNGQLKTRKVFSSDIGDYTLNAETGVVTFLESTTGPVTANFATATVAHWMLIPQPGQTIRIEAAEIQFSQDLLFNDSFIFEVMTNFSVSPTLVNNTRLFYKTLYQVIDEATGSYPVIPAIGGERGTQSAIVGLPLRIGDAIILKAERDDRIVISLKNSIAFGGSRATVTFYCSDLT